MKTAFLVLSHRNPGQTVRLLTTLRRQLPAAPLVVHHDQFRSALTTADVAHLGDVHVLTSPEPIVWGTFSIVDAVWRSLGWMTDRLEFDWIVLLSAQDYPIKPLADFGAFLAGTDADVVLNARPVDQIADLAARRNRRRRYLYQCRPVRVRLSVPAWLRAARRVRNMCGPAVGVVNNVQPWLQIYRVGDGLPWRVGVRSRSAPFTADQPCWFGSMWFGISRSATAKLLAAVADQPGYVDYFRRTMVPDEAVTASILGNLAGIRMLRQDLHFIRWTTAKKTGHPDVLTSADLPELLAASEYFARKFDVAVDADILDALDRHIGAAAAPALE
jgi:Core-2/I-Branching enzyme